MSDINPPKFTLTPTTRHVREGEHHFRVWEGTGEHGTKIELLVRVAGMLGPDLDGLNTWFDGAGHVATQILDAGNIPLVTVTLPSKHKHH